MQGNRIDEIHNVAHLRKRKGGRAGGAANVEDNGWRRRQKANQEVKRPDSFPTRNRIFQATGLLPRFVVAANFGF